MPLDVHWIKNIRLRGGAGVFRPALSCLLLLFALPGLLLAAPRPASGSDVWQAVLSDYDAAPSFLIAVDKQSQQLFAFERHSPMRLVAEYPCTTGQSVGDKYRTGDLKTPEGVYFVVRHITGGLDYTLYGKEAYPLNYPNPVDKLRKKTGYGIWIHGKGVPLEPRDTQGCVGMNNGDIALLGNKIHIGQPVTLAADVLHKPEISALRAESIAKLENSVLEWARAWSNRSSKLFDFYDPESYSIAQGQPFSQFRGQKERLFKTLDWIETTVSDIQVLEGPGYWVTWFNQDYRAPNLSTSGTRRLYWQKNAAGQLRIVGMEWLPGLQSPFMLASADKRAVPVPPELKTAALAGNAPESATERTIPAEPGQTGLTARADGRKNPEPAQTAALTSSVKSPVSDTAQAPATAPEQPVTLAEAGLVHATERMPLKKGAPALATPALSTAALEKPALPAVKKEIQPAVQDVQAMIEKWRQTWENGDLDGYASFYSSEATQGQRNFKQMLAQKKTIWAKAKPVKVTFDDIRITRTARGFSVNMLQTYTDSKGYSDKGVKTVLVEADGKTMRITREDWTPEI